MSYSGNARIGNQRPQILLKPSNIADTHAEDVAGLSKAYGLTPDEWQYTVLEAWLGETEDGLFAASRCGLAVPRQNGKNGILEMVELYKMCILNRQILHTAHEVKTQRKAFVRLCGFFENKRQYPELAAMVKEIRRTNGQEAIVLKDGGSIEFVARSKRSARGFTVDDLVLDEAQELTEDQFAALLPTISAAKSGDPQTIMTGTPPPIFDEELAFCRMREAGNKGEDPNLAWIEWSDNRNPYEFDVKNIDHAYKTNPALGIRISERTVLDEAESMSAEMYARERLGRWADVDLSAGVFPEGLFDTLADKESHPGKQLYFAVDVSPTRDSASIVVASPLEDGRIHCEVVENREGTQWLSRRLTKLKDRWKPKMVLAVGGSSAESMIPKWRQDGAVVKTMSFPDYKKACGLFYDLVIDERLVHLGDAVLKEAVMGADRAWGADKANWYWSRQKSHVDITPLVAATIAVGAIEQKPNRRKSRGNRMAIL